MHKNAGKFCSCCVSIIFEPADRLHFLHIVDLNIHKDDERHLGLANIKSRCFLLNFVDFFDPFWMCNQKKSPLRGHTMQNLQASFCWAPNFPTAVPQMPPGPLTRLDVCNIERFVPLLPARFSPFRMWAMASCVGRFEKNVLLGLKKRQHDIPWFVECLSMFFFVNLDVTLPETNSSPLKLDGWNTILSYWGFSPFSGTLDKLLVSGSVFPPFWRPFLPSLWGMNLITSTFLRRQRLAQLCFICGCQRCAADDVSRRIRCPSSCGGFCRPCYPQQDDHTFSTAFGPRATVIQDAKSWRCDTCKVSNCFFRWFSWDLKNEMITLGIYRTHGRFVKQQCVFKHRWGYKTPKERFDRMNHSLSLRWMSMHPTCHCKQKRWGFGWPPKFPRCLPLFCFFRVSGSTPSRSWQS